MAVLDEARAALERSVNELREQLGQAEEALAKLSGTTTGRKPGRRGPGRPKGGGRGKATKSTGATRIRRKRKGGTRADKAVRMVEKRPGISASEIAKAMKIKPNYLYRVMGDLEEEGRVKKNGRQYFPAAA
ncbi:MAG TPA: hypothetical protein VG448_06050 [Solirubrobacterales bacterium]|nr:hypothetical protein [Solirubrobacterales bacterium]